MITLEKLVGEVKQLPRDEQKRLLEILQQEVAANQYAKISHSEQRESPILESINLKAVDPELKWLMENGWVLQKYRGEYIALEGNELIAHGTLGEVLAESKRRGIEHPFTQYIPKTEKEWLLGQGNYPVD
jgi:hypothetical protein